MLRHMSIVDACEGPVASQLPRRSGCHQSLARLMRGAPGRGRARSVASSEASGGDFRYCPERRHLLALQYLTKRANRRHRTRLFDHLIGARQQAWPECVCGP
jgi:hypothetical protein